MLKRFLAAAALALFSAAVFAAVDVNKANQADLESIKGIGPMIATKILDERKKGAFKDWNDMIERVKGVGEHNAARFSTDGLTVNGAAFAGAPAAPAKGANPAAATTSRTAAKTPETAGAAMKPSPTAATTAAASAPTMAKTKAEERAEKKAARDEAKAAKADAKASKTGMKADAKSDAKAMPAAPASAPAATRTAASAPAAKK